MSESRQLLLRLIAEQAESAAPERARALEDLASAIEELPPFWLDVLRPEMLRKPAVSELLDGYGVDAGDPDRFIQALGNALPDATAHGRPPWRREADGSYRSTSPGGLTLLLNLLETSFDLLLAGVKGLGLRTVRWWRERSQA